MDKINFMHDSKEGKWEAVAPTLERTKVEGGYLYRSYTVHNECMCFVPAVDLTRYEAHLRDAYRKGYEDGQSDAKHGQNILS